MVKMVNKEKVEEQEKIIISTSTGSVRIEIAKAEATPEKIADICRPLLGEKTEKSKDLDAKLTIKRKEEPTTEAKILRDRDITEDEIRKYAKKIPSLREISEYIHSNIDFKHSFRDMQMKYLGTVLSPDNRFPNQQKVYRMFYSKLHRVHTKIEEQYNGTWADETRTPIDEPKYKIWWFEKSDLDAKVEIRGQKTGTIKQ